ncbi:MAG: DNA repair protein RecO [bacterium]|nr:DNA repair protein RecO [bacterium]
MPTFRTKAIVLKSHVLNENSKIVTLITTKFGKISAVAKGSKKITSKFGAILEVFAYLDMQLYQKESRELYTLIQAKLISSHSLIKEDLKKTATALCLVEILDHILTGKKSDLKIFLLTFKTLQFISKNYHPFYIYAYILKLFSFLGLRMHLTNCLQCKKEVLNKTKLSFLEGGVICLKCNNDSKAIDIDFEMLNLLRNLLYLKLTQISKLPCPKESLRDLKRIILDNYINYYLPSPLKSLKFYEEIIIT